jgi:5'-3' exonuclease
MKPCNVIFDGNYLFHSEFSIFASYSKSAKFSTEGDEVSFVQGVANKFFYALGHLPKGGKVVFCIDSRSWRKSVEIPGTEYKASRENEDGSKGQMDKDTKEKFYKLMNEFCDILKSVGIIVSRIAGAEGDDLIFRWTEFFYEKGENCIVMSGDRDMTQTVKMRRTEDEHEPWIIQWNNNSKHNRMYIPEGWQQSWLNRSSSIFEMDMNNDRLAIKQHITDFAIDLQVVHPGEVVFNKILVGDDGDDVPPACSYEGKTKEGKPKTVRLTDSIAGKVIAAMREKFGSFDPATALQRFHDEAYMTTLAGIILRVMKTVDGTEERKVIVESLKRNKKLVHLSVEELPANLVGVIDDHIKTTIEDLRTQRDKWNRKGLFEGTRFSENVAPKRDDPFAFFNVPE